MKILFCHNTYRLKGGEDQVCDKERALLTQQGNEVVLHLRNNEQIKSIKDKLSTSLQLNYSHSEKNALLHQLEEQQPSVVHVHNFFPILTPAIYDACVESNTPVIQTLHNYRTICPSALLMRDGKLCETCINHSPYHAVLHKCYRDSMIGSFFVANMVAYHRKHKTWLTRVNRFVALTHFAKSKFVEAGFPADKIRVKPNFIEDPFKGQKTLPIKQQQALFVGRFSQEKGVSVLLEAWQSIQYPLQLAGDGPTFDNCKGQSFTDYIHFLGSQTSEQVHLLMSQAQFLVMPSIWYEGFPMVLVEAFAHGVPVICSRLGGMAEIVEDRVTGLHFEAGNADDLAEKINWLIAHPYECEIMGENARTEYLEKYTPETNYKQLMSIYQEAIDESKKSLM